MNATDGRVREATRKQMLDYETILTNERGDELWRFCNGADGKPRWKVWAVEPTNRTAIRKYKDAVPGAYYYQTGRHVPHGQKYVGSDFIIPRKYLRRIAKLLGLDLRKNQPRNLTPNQLAYRQKFVESKKAQTAGSRKNS